MVPNVLFGNWLLGYWHGSTLFCPHGLQFKISGGWKMISLGRSLVCCVSLANIIRGIGKGRTGVSVFSVCPARNGSTFPHRCDGIRAGRPRKLFGMQNSMIVAMIRLSSPTTPSRTYNARNQKDGAYLGATYRRHMISST